MAEHLLHVMQRDLALEQARAHFVSQMVKMQIDAAQLLGFAVSHARLIVAIGRPVGSPKTQAGGSLQPREDKLLRKAGSPISLTFKQARRINVQ